MLDKIFFYYFTLNFYIYRIEELFLRLEEEKNMKRVFVNKTSLKYILVGNPIRVKNLSEKFFLDLPFL